MITLRVQLPLTLICFPLVGWFLSNVLMWPVWRVYLTHPARKEQGTPFMPVLQLPVAFQHLPGLSVPCLTPSPVCVCTSFGGVFSSYPELRRTEGQHTMIYSLRHQVLPCRHHDQRKQRCGENIWQRATNRGKFTYSTFTALTSFH